MLNGFIKVSSLSLKHVSLNQNRCKPLYLHLNSFQAINRQFQAHPSIPGINTGSSQARTLFSCIHITAFRSWIVFLSKLHFWKISLHIIHWNIFKLIWHPLIHSFIQSFIHPFILLSFPHIFLHTYIHF